PDDPGNDEDGGGGGGGGGGAIYIYYDNAYTFTGSYHVNGGTGGNGPGIAEEGGNGANGNIFISKIQFTSFFLYASTGSYISPVIDAGRIAFWKNISITYDTHWSGTSIDVYYKVWNDTEPGWSYLTTLSGGTSVQNFTISLPPSAFGRFLKYNLTLNTSFPLMPGWPYMRRIVINNTANSNTLTNYTVNLTLDTASLIMAGKMRSDCGDIRFTDANGIEIPYWIESGINTANTKIWVKVPSIAGGGRTSIFLYYGNLSAQSKSNGTATFLFFDDFESGNLNNWQAVIDSIWSIGTIAHNGIYAMKAGAYSGESDRYIIAKNLNLTNISFDAWWYLNSSAVDISQCLRATASTPINAYEINWEQSDWAIAKIINNGWTPISSTISSPPSPYTWYKVTLLINGTNMKFLLNDTQLLPSSGWLDMGTQLSNGTVAFRTWTTSSGDWYIDDVHVRAFSDPEPTTYVLSERTPSSSPTIYSVNLQYHKPKLLITRVIFPNNENHTVVLYNNDTMDITYKELMLNSSRSAYKIDVLTLAPGATEKISVGKNFFNDPASAGDYLFLNDSTYGFQGREPNGIIDFVNWTDINGNPPPSDGNIALKNKEWFDGPVNLNTAQSYPDSINRTEISNVPVDTDRKEDWVVPESSGLQILVIFPIIFFLYLRYVRKTRKTNIPLLHRMSI
ncbi:MAG: DUF2341 domain-containing protein, partial [Thermoplasmata archaeon]